MVLPGIAWATIGQIVGSTTRDHRIAARGRVIGQHHDRFSGRRDLDAPATSPSLAISDGADGSRSKTPGRQPHARPGSTSLLDHPRAGHEGVEPAGEPVGAGRRPQPDASAPAGGPAPGRRRARCAGSWPTGVSAPGGDRCRPEPGQRVGAARAEHRVDVDPPAHAPGRPTSDRRRGRSAIVLAGLQRMAPAVGARRAPRPARMASIDEPAARLDRRRALPVADEPVAPSVCFAGRRRRQTARRGGRGPGVHDPGRSSTNRQSTTRTDAGSSGRPRTGSR